VDIPGVPDTIPMWKLAQISRDLGIDPRECCGLEWEPGANVLYVTVYGSQVPDKPPGKFARYFTGGREGQAAKHRIAIPVTDGPDPREVGRDVVDAIKDYEGRNRGWSSPEPPPDDPEPQPA
jgi:hypothetical protein